MPKTSTSLTKHSSQSPPNENLEETRVISRVKHRFWNSTETAHKTMISPDLCVSESRTWGCEATGLDVKAAAMAALASWAVSRPQPWGAQHGGQMLLVADQTVVMLGATLDLEKDRKIHVSLRDPARGSEAPAAMGSENKQTKTPSQKPATSWMQRGTQGGASYRAANVSVPGPLYQGQRTRFHESKADLACEPDVCSRWFQVVKMGRVGRGKGHLSCP